MTRSNLKNTYSGVSSPKKNPGISLPSPPSLLNYLIRYSSRNSIIRNADGERESLETAIKKRLASFVDKSEGRGKKTFDILWKGVRIGEQSGSRLDNRLPRLGSWSPMEERKEQPSFDSRAVITPCRLQNGGDQVTKSILSRVHAIIIVAPAV